MFETIQERILLSQLNKDPEETVHMFHLFHEWVLGIMAGDFHPVLLPGMDRCLFGKWLGSITDPCVLSTQMFMDLDILHYKLHEHAERAIFLGENNQDDLANAEIILFEDVIFRSLELLNQLIAIKNGPNLPLHTEMMSPPEVSDSTTSTE